MPRVLLFVPCERVIFGAGDQAASLIVILQDLQVHGGAVPRDAVALSRFSVFSQWYKSVGDEGKTFEQKVALAYMNESPILEHTIAFQFRINTRIHRMVINFTKFPALKSGEYDLTLSLREQGESMWPQPIVSYPVNVTFVPKLEPQIQ